MTTTHYRLTGSNGESAVVPCHAVADTVTPWYPDAPAEVLEAIAELQHALNFGGVSYDAPAVYLGLDVQFAGTWDPATHDHERNEE